MSEHFGKKNLLVVNISVTNLFVSIIFTNIFGHFQLAISATYLNLITTKKR